jgi:hypothetical protein
VKTAWLSAQKSSAWDPRTKRCAPSADSPFKRAFYVREGWRVPTRIGPGSSTAGRYLGSRSLTNALEQQTRDTPLVFAPPKELRTRSAAARTRLRTDGS